MNDPIVCPPTLVLMAGLPGAGKTTLADALGRVLGWPIFDKDEIKRACLNTGMADIQAGMIAYEAVFTLARDLLVRQHLSLILDTASLHLFILERATKIVQADNARLKIILCTVASDIRDQRLKERKGAIAQHIAKPSTPEQDMQCFRHLPPDRFVIDTCTPLAECVAQVRHYLLNEYMY